MDEVAKIIFLAGCAAGVIEDVQDALEEGVHVDIRDSV